MKKILCLLTLAILSVLTFFSCAGQVGNSNGINNFNIKRGTNLSHWLSQSRVVGEERRNHIQEDDFERLEQLGFDFVRIPIDEVQFWDEDGNKLPVSGYAPVFKIDVYGHIVYSVDGGITWVNIYDEYGNPVTSSSGCDCTKFFQNVYISGDYLYLVLIDGTVVKIRINGDNGNNRGDIPEDPNTPSPDVPDPNTPIPYPNVQPSVDDWGNYVVTMNLTGIQDPNSGDWLDLYGTGLSTQNVWVDVDGSPKGILVINLEDNVTRVKNDIVFTVDNSGSMGAEADAIARDIISWAQMLTNNNLDVKFGVVGYGGYVDGAINITDVTTLSSFLNAYTGTSRTSHFGGNDATTLKNYANSYPKTGSYTDTNECGAMAIEFANDYFNFRAGSNRIYVNFTDEPNQPDGNTKYSVEWFKSQQNWPTSNGTVHTVYSSGSSISETINKQENHAVF